MASFANKFDSRKQSWTTPESLFSKLNDEFHFTTDLAATQHTTKCQKYLTDALNQQWSGVCWLNPPYGSKESKLSDWIKKAFAETRKDDCIVVMLIPARTNTKWWHNYCMKASEIRFIEGRPKFGDCKHGLPQPLTIVVFNNIKSYTKFSSFRL